MHTYERQSDIIFVCVSAFLVLSSGFEWFNLSTSLVEVTSWFFVCVFVLKAIVRMKVHHVTFLFKSRHFEEHVFIPSKGTMKYPKSLHKPCNSFVCGTKLNLKSVLICPVSEMTLRTSSVWFLLILCTDSKDMVQELKSMSSFFFFTRTLAKLLYILRKCFYSFFFFYEVWTLNSTFNLIAWGKNHQNFLWSMSLNEIISTDKCWVFVCLKISSWKLILSFSLFVSYLFLQASLSLL